MILRWIYHTWNFLLKFLGYLILLILIFAGLTLAIIQMPQSKDYFKSQIESSFHTHYAGTVSIESMQGFIPFRTQLNNVAFHDYEKPEEHVLSAEALFLSIDIWQLIQGNINITSLEFHRPDLSLKKDEQTLNIQKIFTRTSPRTTPDNSSNVANRFSIFAPEIKISNGRFEVDKSVQLLPASDITYPVLVSEMQAEFFLESIRNQQFIDIVNFTAFTNVEDIEELSISGQLFNDGTFLELNGLNINTNSTTIRLSAEASPFDIFEANVADQLQKATFQLDIQRIFVQSSLIQKFTDRLNFITKPLDFEGFVEGDLDSLWIDNLQISNGSSYLLADGRLSQLRTSDFQYEFSVNNLVLDLDDIRNKMPEQYAEIYSLDAYGPPTFRGVVAGTLDSVLTDIDLETNLGNSNLNGNITFSGRPVYDFALQMDSLDLSPLVMNSTGSTLLNGRLFSSGSGFDATAELKSSFNFPGSIIYGRTFEELNSEIEYTNQNGSYSIRLRNNNTEGTATGTFSTAGQNQFSIEAVVQNLNLVDYFDDTPYSSTDFSGIVSANVAGKNVEDLFGRLSIQMDEASIDGDTLRPHQVYMDLNEATDGNSRSLRLTSSFLNLNMNGSLYPQKLINASRYWYQYLNERVNDELFFSNKLPAIQGVNRKSASIFSDEPIDLSVQFSARDLNLLKAYIPNMPELQSSASFTLNMNATPEAFSANGTFFDDSLRVNQSYFKELGINFTSVVDYGETLKSSALADLQINSPDILLNSEYNISDASVNLSLRDSILTARYHVDNALENLSFHIDSETIWQKDRLSTTIDSLSAGSSAYRWNSVGKPVISFNREGTLTLDQLVVESQEDYFEVDGTFSNTIEDSVRYNIRNFKLGRVSELIGGRIQFEGVVNGEFTTRALTQVPSIQGDLSVTGGRLNNRVVGDVSLRSRFNPDEERFDTEVHVYTDPEKYSDYIANNNGVGHDLFFEGYFRTPENDDDETDMIYFDADFREIDMWIVTAIVPNIINQMEGRATGSGFFKVNPDGYDFEANFEVENVSGVPAFTNVPYTLGGNLIFNRSDGLLFNQINLADGRGGTGILTGQVDLDDFGPMNYLDLRMELNNLRFMNNIQDPNVPFFADLSGSGVAVLDGTSISPRLRSLTPINLSSNSNISIPLQEETELEQDRRFIQFVDSFEELRPIRMRSGQAGNGSEEEEDIDLTFVELFNMNLQFVANNPIGVQLIFDPVTNDILSTTGTGQITLILEDQDVSMYGRFNISGGEYQFVGGDIFTRRFEIQDGGTISWQGDLTDANLDVTASYRARPDISTLLPAGTSFQRIPVELILQIGGTISELANEFFFQLPSGIEGTQDPTVTAQINRINQNEDEKVLQAFGILLTGNFVPSDDLQNPEFGNVTGTNALVNPLLSSQIISPLLSNQINSLLRSDITFDVDFNLNAFNEVDLGVALRLFNDRIILRREGQITGESEVGDLGATYRINRTFSVTAFHRQNITLSNRSETESRQTQEMNGVGLEAQFQFNTWQNLKNRIANSFRNLFGIKEKESEVEEDQSLAEN